MKYTELKKIQQDRVDSLPIQFAFNKEQFREGMAALGLTENDKDKVVSIGYGGFCLKSDSKMILDTFYKNNTELEEAMKNDDFCIDALIYELNNHEFGYTGDPDYAIYALGLKKSDPRTKRLLTKAIEIGKFFD